MSYTGWILLTASLVGLSCGLIGVLLILRRMAMMADAISHTVLLGIVCAYLITRELTGIHMLIGAVIAGLITAFFIQWLHSRGVQQEASIGIVFTTLFAIGVILIATKVGNAHLDVKHTLMGEITFIPWERVEVPILGSVPEAVVLLSGVLFVILLVIITFYKEWKITSFDPALAASLGIPVIFMHYLFMSLVSLTTVAAFDAVGAIMVVAMLITPAAAAYLWTDRLSFLFLLSSGFGILSAFIGYYMAVWLDTSISGAMAFSTGIIFMISFLCSPRYGVLAKRMTRRKHNQRTYKIS
ncbi:Mn2+/Zn2+ ABC transporter permease [Niallia circulans]|uniref:metal ABC transporter permease n=1 Tax=Niallia circulans TaxID=1397 RepID=UPI00077CBE63|nr:metal ABC transporter permease [Niallia circulans]MDR4316938.1 metal ABC transporter permease [Niallia circulans]MED3840066.1 metal ABC transporter permease [Niallia circulans]MED4241753.1 metal ABC transporter permease [Niallia circulans]MED4250296.1 metal ABC transporter permease [Niallia circulans]MED5099206.1 metal ABC transporter permease [Niallia circulans]